MNKSIYEIGFWSGMIAFVATAGFVIVQILQLVGTLTYPWDEISIYSFSLCITLPFLFEILALHYISPSTKKYWSHAALLLALMYVIFVTANYVVQLATVIPMTLQGKAEEIGLLIQTPHSLFWNFDAIGYIFMGLATFCAAPIFGNKGFQKWLKYTFLAHGLVTPLIAFVYFHPDFSESLLLLGLPWGITAPACMLMLAVFFRKNRKKGT